VHDLEVAHLALAADVVGLASRPAASTRRIAAQWSPTYSQSRTLAPSPYTGSGLPSSALRIISGISFSGNWYGP